MTIQYRAVLSPCIGICESLCSGCHRTGDEVAAWPLLNDDVRLHLMDEVLPRRAAVRGG